MSYATESYFRGFVTSFTPDVVTRSMYNFWSSVTVVAIKQAGDTRWPAFNARGGSWYLTEMKNG